MLAILDAKTALGTWSSVWNIFLVESRLYLDIPLCCVAYMNFVMQATIQGLFYGKFAAAQVVKYSLIIYDIFKVVDPPNLFQMMKKYENKKY